ncbi:helix-turn-helix domain-containing protein [Arthrobacter sp. H14]|uniref:helix-turn-helix domain-containing protein n=1 Tax=Arthrobacter sp. H14 TaxID=1312959 RepID=UPI0004B528FB|nr:helix-turn-helix domain-containing protein [Arthrobacter sp. H14]
MGLFATLAEYERELINERVRAGVAAAQARGVKFGKKAPDPEKVENEVSAARRLLADGKTATQAADAVNWSRATLYRNLKLCGAEGTIRCGCGIGRARKVAVRAEEDTAQSRIIPGMKSGRNGSNELMVSSFQVPCQ